MTLDQYSYCPCGNGKKIKFCKCNEHFQEMQTIHRMITGEQNVAALDRINSNLKTMPSEPWLLAMKCELLLQLRELDSLEESSAKFIRLQPDNPLAKLYRALVAVIRANTEEAASLLLQAIGDSADVLPPMTATVSLNLMEVLAKRGMVLPAILHCDMLLDLNESTAEMASNVYDQLVSSTNANTLSRDSLPSLLSFEGQPYAERLTEANALIGAYRIAVAKTKLESMVREFGNQAPILQAMLYCQLMLTDLESAGSTCKKIAEVESVSEPQRIYYQALAYELGPRKNGAAIDEELCQYAIEDSEFEQKLTTSKSLLPIDPREMKNLLMSLLDEEVPPMHCFVCVQPALAEQFPELEASSSGSWVAYYGKQTDKPARLVALEPPRGPKRLLLEKVKQELGLTSMPRVLLEKLPTSYLSQVSASLLIRKEIAPERRDALNDATRQLSIDTFLDFTMDCFQGKSPREASQDPSNRIRLQALLLHWQCSGSSGLTDAQFKAIHAQLGLSVPQISASEDVFDLVGGASYFWTNLSDIDPRSLVQLMQSAMVRNVSSVFVVLAEKSAQTQWPDDLKDSAHYTELNLRARSTTDPNVAESILRQIVESGKKLGVPVGNAVLERVEVLNMLGRSAESRQYLEQSLRDNPEDPVLLQFIQMAMMRQEQMMRARGGAPAAKVTPSSAPSSGLWTPGQDAAPVAQPQSNSGGGGSKLWIPGQ
jgi:tetratricopeptide (TPR) repeat protein